MIGFKIKLPNDFSLVTTQQECFDALSPMLNHCLTGGYLIGQEFELSIKERLKVAWHYFDLNSKHTISEYVYYIRCEEIFVKFGIQIICFLRG